LPIWSAWLQASKENQTAGVEVDVPDADEPEPELSDEAAALAGLVPLLRKSVTYQPDPFN